MKDFKEVERISKLIVKRRLGRISEKETKELQEWENRSPGHTTLSEKWLSADYLGEDYAEFTSIDSKRAEAEMRSRGGLIVKKESRRGKLILRFSGAAAILVVLGVALTLSLRTSVPEIEDVIVGAPLPAQEVVLITGNTSVPLANNAELILSNEGTISIVGNEGDAGVKLAASEMNRLIVPVGKLSSVTLPDGSKVWLNAGSELEFATKFAATRRAVTISGEVYI